jgi:uncharacterized repeat protein (TIGR01451 family)
VNDGWPGDLDSHLNSDGLTFGTDIEQILGPGAVCDVGSLTNSGDIVVDQDEDGKVVCNGTGKVDLNAQNQTMSVTIVSHGAIVISGQGANLSPASHEILAWTDQDSETAAESIVISGSNFTVPDKAILFAPRSGIDVGGSDDSSLCIQLIAQGKIKVQGSRSSFGPGACEEPPPLANPKCTDLEGDGQDWSELKVDPNADGNFTDGTLAVTITHTQADKVFSWTSNIGVDAVFVKGGSSGNNLYRYDPPTEKSSDTGLTTPGQNAISHISFCYDVEPELEVEKTPDNSAEAEGTITAGATAKFAIRVKNTGDAAATNVTLDDALPNDGGITWTLTSATNDGANAAANCSSPPSSAPGNNMLDCLFPSLGAGKEIVVVVTSTATSVAYHCNGAQQDLLIDNGTVTGGAADADADNADADSDTGKIAVTCPPGTLIVRKVVVNDNGGTKVAADFGFSVDGGAAQAFPDDGPPALQSQTQVSVAPGTHTVTEPAVEGYTTSYENCSNVQVPSGGSATCTITNDDRPAKLIVVKHVVNDNGGTKVASDFQMTVDDPGTNPPSFPGAESPGTEVTVDPGSYAVSEVEDAGYAASYSADCTGTIAIGETKTCTITNDDKPAKLVVIKHVVNDNGGTKVASDFQMTVDDPGTNPPSFPGAESPGTEVTVDPGSYAVSEVEDAGYAASYSADCTGTIAIGQTKTCTVTNDDKAPKLTLVKVVVNDNGGTAQASAWNLTASGPTGFNGAGPSVSSGAGFDQGTYDLSESGSAGYSASDWNCGQSPQVDGDTVTVGLGADVTCAITNNDNPATLTVIKAVVNDDGGTKAAADFPITVTGNGPNPANFSGAESPGTPVAIGPGSYNVTEIEDPGYAASYSADCQGTIALGESKTCTITNNDKPATLIVIKSVINDNGGTATAAAFQMTINGVTADGGNSFPGQAAPGTSKTLSSVGSYNVTETPASGYTQTDASAGCSGTIALGETKTCTITNDDQPPKLTLVKVVVNDNGGTAQPSAWALSATGPTGFTGSGPSVSSNASFEQGTYNLSEAGPSGHAASDWDCGEGQNQVDADTVNVGLGEDVTCTITNDDRPATLIVIKNVVNDDGGTATASDFQMTIDGVTAQGGNTFAGAAAPGVSKTLTSVGTYSVAELPVAGYTQTGASADCQGTIALGQTKTCTITNNDNPPTITARGSILVQKSADPTSVKEPGGPVDFTVTITNTSSIGVTIDSVVDSVYGDLDDTDGGAGVFDTPINLAPGEKVSKTFQRNVTGTGGQVHTNVVTASGSDAAGNKVSDSDDARVEITPRLIDLVVVKTATSPTPLNGIVNYSMTVANKGPDTATNVMLADPAPTGITYLTVNTSKGTCNLNASLITCSLGSLTAGESVTINVTARATAVGTHTNVATVTGGGGRETNPADNVDDAITIVPAPFIPPAQPKPKPKVKPAAKPVCLTLTVSPKMIKADGKPDRVSVKVTAGKQRVKGTKVTVYGAGVRKSGRSNGKGMAIIRINPTKPGLITITARETNQRVCGPKRIGVVGVFLPPLTG